MEAGSVELAIPTKARSSMVATRPGTAVGLSFFIPPTK